MPLTRYVLGLAALVLFALPAPAQEGRRIAFLVGVGKYDHDFSDLVTAPEKDVQELAQRLQDAKFEVTTLTGNGRAGDLATSGNINDRFDKVLKGDRGEALTKDDLLLIVLCGHGIQVKVEDPNTKENVDQPFFCPRNAVPNTPKTMVGINDLIEKATPFGATTLLLVDACRVNTAPNIRGRIGIQGSQVKLPKKTAIFFSCSKNEVAYQSDIIGHGLFTHAVLKAFEEFRNSGDDLDWSGLVSKVGKAFETTEFRNMMDPNRLQTPVDAKGELKFTRLIKGTEKPKPPPIAQDPFLAELKAYTAARDEGETAESYLGERTERIPEWKKGAAKGSPSAQFLYARCLMDGIGVKEDDNTAHQLYFQSAKAGNAMSMVNLGVMFDNGKGVIQDHAKAMEWYETAAAKGQSAAYVNLGVSYRFGRGVTKDVKKAVELYRKAADQGSSAGMANLGAMYEQGAGVERDYERAVELFKGAVEKKDPHGMFNLARMYQFGLGVAKDQVEAVRLLKRAASLGSASAMNTLGVAYDNGDLGLVGSEPEALEWFRKAAAKNYAGAMYNIGVMYENGRAGLAKSDTKAFEMYKKAADNEDMNGMLYTGRGYVEGKGTAQDMALAVEWFRKAANEGSGPAMVNVGVAYSKGDGVPKDDERAFEWFLKGAEKGNAIGMKYLAERYEEGKGTPKNLGKAIEWYRMAAAKGNKDAKEALQRLGS